MTLTVEAPVNAHSHAFHRLLRGRTHAGDDGAPADFWRWREQMYRLAGALTPESMERLATAVYTEMAVAGWTAVGEFHYLHHAPDGAAYPDHAMERALARAARAAGIRLVLLDTCYLQGGLCPEGRPLPLGEVQRRYADGDVAAWASRWASLEDALAEEDGGAGLVSLGAAVHSLRAVDSGQLAELADWAADRPQVPLHVHLSEQPAENAAVQAAHGLSPAALLHSHRLLSERLSAVHATHLTETDIGLLGRAGSTVVMCPTTEADLGDGIGPARELADAGASIALGSDQHVVLDPMVEMRALEHGERLRTGRRGRFSPAALRTAAVAAGRRSLGISAAAAEDVIELDDSSMRTIGSDPGQLPMTATAADVVAVTVAGERIAGGGVHERLGDPAELYQSLFAHHPELR